MTTLALALIVLTGFADHVSCVVQGHVQRLAFEDDVSFERVDLCPGVRAQGDLNAVVIYGPGAVATVVVPPDAHSRRFQYRWGAPHAYVGDQRLPVARSRFTAAQAK